MARPTIYGPKHRAERRRLAPLVAAGRCYCTEPICLMGDRWIPPGTPWNLAHNRATGGYHGPSHERCNKSEGAVWKQQRPVVVRRWAL